MSERLFVPLKSKYFAAFDSGKKRWELRGINHRFNQDTVQEGMDVELRRGYSTDDNLWGKIEQVETFDSIEGVAEEIDHDKISPGSTENEFYKSAEEMLSKYDSYIAFKVKLDD